MSGLYCQTTALPGELRTHREIVSRLREAIHNQTLSLIVVFPTITLLRFVQDELLLEPDIHGYCGVRFLLFEGFINEIGAQLGLSARQPPLFMKDLLIARCCRELDHDGQLAYFRQIPWNSAFRGAVLGGIAEWKRSGLTPFLFAEWAAEKGRKEQELGLLYQKYQDLLAAYGFAEEDQFLETVENYFLETAAAGIGGASTPAVSCEVILYGFHDLTPLQTDFIKALRPWCRFEALLDPTPVRDFQEFTAKCFAIKPDLFPPTRIPAPASALQMLQDSLWTEDPQIVPLPDGDDSVQLIQAAGSYREAAGIARAIRKWRDSNPGSAWDKVLIIAPEPPDFIKKAKPVFSEYQLVLTETAEPVREFPIVKRVSQSFQIVAGDWQWRDVIPFLSLAFQGDQAQEVDRLVCFLGEHYGAVAGRDRWLALAEELPPQEEQAGSGAVLEQFRETLRLLTAIPEQTTLEGYLRLTRDHLQVGVQQLLRDMAAAMPARAGSDLEPRYFGNVRAAQLLMNTIADLLRYPDLTRDPQQEISFKEYLLFYEETLLGLELEPLPPGQAAIRVIHPREARGIRSELVFITGLEQGHCPRNYINDWKIGLQARWELKTLGIELETGEQYQIQERLAFYWAFQSATQEMYLVCQEQDENGQPQNRSLFLEEIMERIPDLAARALHYPLSPALPSRLADCYSAQEVEGRLARDLMSPLQPPRAPETAPANAAEWTGEVTPAERAAFLALLQQPEYQRLTLQVIAWTQRSFAAEPSLLRDPASLRYLGRVFGPKAVFPVTSLEDYLHCPLRFYLKHLLKIKPLTRPVLRPGGLDLGILYHQVLHDFGVLHRGQALQGELAAQYEAALRELYEHTFQEWRARAANDLEILFLEIQGERIWRTLKKWLYTELEWARQTGGRFRFALLEFAFGFLKGAHDPGSTETPFLLAEAAEPIRIAGKIDRVDADPNGRFIVYDYKLGSGPAGKDLLDLKQLQIPVYLMALEQIKYETGRGIGGSYLGLTNPARWNGGVWRAAALAPERETQTLLGDETWNQWLRDVRGRVAGVVQSIRAGEFGKVAAECMTYCEYRESCRRREWEVESSGELAAESGAE